LPSSAGPSRGLFNTITRLSLTSERMKKSKVTPQKALKILERHFKEDLKGIYHAIS